MRGDLSIWITVFLVLLFSPFVHPVSCQDKEVVVAWDCAAGTHVLWHVKTEGYNGSPVAHQDKILLGANSALPHNPQIKDRHGVFTCFSRKTGKLLWQATHSRLPDRHNDMPGAMFARASVEGNRAYYISNRGELVCLDLNGSQIWKLDMVGELGVFKRDAGDVCSPLPGTLLVGDLVYAVTGNGVDGLTEVPKPKAPSFLAVNKNTGRVVWSSNLPGKDIIYSSWGAPVFAQVTGQDQVIFPGGDGWLSWTRQQPNSG